MSWNIRGQWFESCRTEIAKEWLTGSHALAEAIPNQEKLGNGAKQGVNDFGKIGYVGPCPPRGLAHRYFFKLYALDRMTELKPRATKQQLVDAMNKHFWRKRSWSASTSMGFSSNAA